MDVQSELMVNVAYSSLYYIDKKICDIIGVNEELQPISAWFSLWLARKGVGALKQNFNLSTVTVASWNVEDVEDEDARLVAAENSV